MSTQAEKNLREALDASMALQGDQRTRTLTNADVEAIAEALHERVKTNFYKDLGKGVWRVFWIALIGAIVSIAALGHLNISFGK